MKVSLAKHGGIGAGIRRPVQVVDSDGLSQPSELARLVTAAQTASKPDVDNPGSARDAMSYTITVENDGQTSVFRQSDTAMSAEFAALLAWLEQHFAKG